jgi:hypothetical protein
MQVSSRVDAQLMHFTRKIGSMCAEACEAAGFFHRGGFVPLVVGCRGVVVEHDTSKTRAFMGYIAQGVVAAGRARHRNGNRECPNNLAFMRLRTTCRGSRPYIYTHHDTRNHHSREREP